MNPRLPFVDTWVYRLFHKMPYGVYPRSLLDRMKYRDANPIPLDLLPRYKTLAAKEWESWTSYYLPGFSLDGKTVLDVGAGCGETAYLYILSGAAKVVCYELFYPAFRLIRQNAERLHLPIEAHHAKFHVGDMERSKFDFMKMDIEGGESMLLQLSELPPAVIEIHNPKLLALFLSKFPDLKVVRDESPCFIVRNC